MRQPNVDLVREIRAACSEVTGLDPERVGYCSGTSVFGRCNCQRRLVKAPLSL